MANHLQATWAGAEHETRGHTDELNCEPVALGVEQLRWLSMYGSIDLCHWRWIALGVRKEFRWVYVGVDTTYYIPMTVNEYM